MMICQTFHMSPFQLRRERFSEFCLLVKRYIAFSKKEGEVQKTMDGKEKKFIKVTDYKPIKRG